MIDASRRSVPVARGAGGVDGANHANHANGAHVADGAGAGVGAGAAGGGVGGGVGAGAGVSAGIANGAHPAPATGVLPDVLRATMRQHAAGVAVITTRTARGDGPVGFCATSLNAVTLDPPTVSFTVATGSTSGAAWLTATHGIVHLLRSDQAAVASAFARSGPEKFTGRVGWRWGPHGAPLLDGVLAWMAVSTRIRLVVGDHLLLIAEVRECVVEPGGGPLVHCDGGFHELSALFGGG